MDYVHMCKHLNEVLRAPLRNARDVYYCPNASLTSPSPQHFQVATEDER